jgi:prefoldin subunit 5
MNQEVVKKINSIKAEVTELRSELKDLELNKEVYLEEAIIDDDTTELTEEHIKERIEDLGHIIARLDDQIQKLGKEINNNDWVDSEENTNE